MTSGYLRASDRDRDQVTEVLHAAYAEGKLDLDEHTERTTAALNARTFDELAALTSDLVPAPPTALTPVRTLPCTTVTSRIESPRCWPSPTAPDCGR